jgi:hypothetical protein
MPELRIRGQETQLRLLTDGQLESTITAIRDSTFNVMTKILTEGYLGETTMRRDDIYDGIRGSFTLHPESQDFLILIRKIKERAQRRRQAATPTVTLVSRLVFPNGDTPRIVVPEIFFGEIPINNPGRDQYVNVPFSWEASDFDFITS